LREQQNSETLINKREVMHRQIIVAEHRNRNRATIAKVVAEVAPPVSSLKKKARNQTQSPLAVKDPNEPIAADQWASHITNDYSNDRWPSEWPREQFGRV
jgi:hypothetical protein